jgi:hypothetical protein
LYSLPTYIMDPFKVFFLKQPPLGGRDSSAPLRRPADLPFSQHTDLRPLARTLAEADEFLMNSANEILGLFTGVRGARL